MARPRNGYFCRTDWVAPLFRHTLSPTKIFLIPEVSVSRRGFSAASDVDTLTHQQDSSDLKQVDGALLGILFRLRPHDKDGKPMTPWATRTFGRVANPMPRAEYERSCVLH